MVVVLHAPTPERDVVEARRVARSVQVRSGLQLGVHPVNILIHFYNIFTNKAGATLGNADQESKFIKKTQGVFTQPSTHIKDVFFT